MVTKAAVAYPCSSSRAASSRGRASADSGSPLASPPCSDGWSPVSIERCAGPVVGMVVKAASWTSPRAARASRLGDRSRPDP